MRCRDFLIRKGMDSFDQARVQARMLLRFQLDLTGNSRWTSDCVEHINRPLKPAHQQQDATRRVGQNGYNGPNFVNFFALDAHDPLSFLPLSLLNTVLTTNHHWFSKNSTSRFHGYRISSWFCTTMPNPAEQHCLDKDGYLVALGHEV